MRLIRFFFSALVISVMAGCSRPSHEMGDGKIPFTLEQAQDIFEREVVPATRSQERSSYRSKLSPGEFTPCWEEAVIYSEDGLVGFIMPIQAEFNIYSYKRTPDNIIHRPWRRVKQELVICKDIFCRGDSVFIKSTVKRFGLKMYENYSGIVVYTSLNTGSLLGIEAYDNDQMVAKVFKGGKESEKLALGKVMDLFEGYSFAYKKSIATRSDDGEDDPWGEDEGDFTPVGGGVYVDEYGDYWYDGDHDGIPDVPLDPDDDGFMEGIDWDAFLESGFDHLSEGFILGQPYIPNPMFHRLASDDVLVLGPVPQYSFSNASFLSAYVYADMVVGSGTYTQSTLLSEYMNTYSVSQQTVMSSGLAIPYLKTFTSDIFATNQVSNIDDIKDTIDSGSIMLALTKSYSGSFHAIVIVGYNTLNDSLIYLYGEDGHLYEESPNHRDGVKIPIFVLTQSLLD